MTTCLACRRLQDVGHTDSYGDYSYSVEHTYAAYGNYTLQLDVTNDVGQESVSTVQQVEPTLSQVVQIQESQHSLPVPLEVTFSVTFIQSPGASLNDVWMTCESDFGDGSAVTTEEFVLTGEHNITHTYTTSSAGVPANITCHNHVSTMSYTPTIVLLVQGLVGFVFIINARLGLLD